MKVLKATSAQYKALNGYQKNLSRLEFSKDGNNNWVVNMAVLEDVDFKDIRNDLLQLSVIDYVEPQIELN